MFRFRQFSVRNELAALKVGTDAVLLGASMDISPSSRRLLDIGTGTGVIALMAAQRLSGLSPHWSIDAIDADAAAISEAADNFARSPWGDSLHAVLTPLQEFEPDCEYDAIFSNPPYYDASLLNPDARKALARHTSGLSKTDICEFASRSLRKGGRLSVILPADDSVRMRRIAAGFNLNLQRIISVRTVERKPARRVVMEFLKNSPCECSEEELVIMADGKYSPAYQSLVSEFLLYLPSDTI